MNVTSYSLTLNSTSLHPCQHDVEVLYSRPRSATTSARAMVRLYRQEVRSSPSEGTTVRAAVPATSVYVAERWATGQWLYWLTVMKIRSRIIIFSLTVIETKLASYLERKFKWNWIFLAQNEIINKIVWIMLAEIIYHLLLRNGALCWHFRQIESLIIWVTVWFLFHNLTEKDRSFTKCRIDNLEYVFVMGEGVRCSLRGSYNWLFAW